jgi:DNA topoisomerase-1
MDNGAPSNGDTIPGISIRNGPIEDADVDMQDAGSDANGSGLSKRKSRGSAGKIKSYAEPDSSGEDDKPLVRHIPSAPPPPLPPSAHVFVTVASNN